MDFSWVAALVPCHCRIALIFSRLALQLMVSQGALHTFVGLVVIKKSSVDKTTEKVGLALTFFVGLGLPLQGQK